MSTFGQILIPIDEAELVSGWLERIGDEWKPLVLPEFWTALYRRPQPSGDYRNWLDHSNAKPVERWIAPRDFVAEHEEHDIPIKAPPAILFRFQDASEAVSFKMRWM